MADRDDIIVWSKDYTEPKEKAHQYKKPRKQKEPKPIKEKPIKEIKPKVNNMTQGDAGQNISKFASSSMEASKISSSMPYISYVDLLSWLMEMYNDLLNAADSYFTSHPSVESRSAAGFKAFTATSSSYAAVFICDGYRLCRAAKLLMSLGYGNFTTIIQYDIYAQAERYVAAGHSWSKADFDADPSFSLYVNSSVKITNSPNLSLFPVTINGYLLSLGLVILITCSLPII